MKDAEYLDHLAQTISQLFGPSFTAARLETIAVGIRQRDQIDEDTVRVDRVSPLGTIIVGMDRAYTEVGVDVYHDLLADVAKLKQKVWAKLGEANDRPDWACPGHEPGPNDPMGVSVYCDGSCR